MKELAAWLVRLWKSRDMEQRNEILKVLVRSGQEALEALTDRLARIQTENKSLLQEIDMLTEQEVDWEKRLVAVEAERDAFRELAGLKAVDLAEAKRLVLQMQNEEAEWRQTATREALLAHYDCAISNWSIAIDQRDSLYAELLNLKLDMKKRRSFDA